MNTIAAILALTLAVQEAPPASACKVNDNACNARDFERRAEQTNDPTMRAWRLHSAHRSYLFLFDETGKVEHLCAARRAYERSITVKDLPARERSSLTARLAELETRERQHRPSCRKKTSRPRRDPPLLASASTKRPADAGADLAEVRPGQAGETSSERAVVGDSEARAALAAAPEVSRETPPAGGAPAHASPRVDPLPVRRPQRAVRNDGRSLVIAGSMSLLAGLAVSAAAGVAGGRVLATSRELWTLHDSANGTANADQLAQDAALRDDYRRQLPSAVALVVASGGLLVIGAVLTGVGGRRLARARLALSPTPDGLALHARF